MLHARDGIPQKGKKRDLNRFLVEEELGRFHFEKEMERR